MTILPSSERTETYNSNFNQIEFWTKNAAEKKNGSLSLYDKYFDYDQTISYSPLKGREICNMIWHNIK